MPYTPKEVSYHFEIGRDLYEVNFKRLENRYAITIFCNNIRKHDLNFSLECSLNTATEILSDYLTKKHNQ